MSAIYRPFTIGNYMLNQNGGNESTAYYHSANSYYANNEWYRPTSVSTAPIYHNHHHHQHIPEISVTPSELSPCATNTIASTTIPLPLSYQYNPSITLPVLHHPTAIYYEMDGDGGMPLVIPPPPNFRNLSWFVETHVLAPPMPNPSPPSVSSPKFANNSVINCPNDRCPFAVDDVARTGNGW